MGTLGGEDNGAIADEDEEKASSADVILHEFVYKLKARFMDPERALRASLITFSPFEVSWPLFSLTGVTVVLTICWEVKGERSNAGVWPWHGLWWKSWESPMPVDHSHGQDQLHLEVQGMAELHHHWRVNAAPFRDGQSREAIERVCGRCKVDTSSRIETGHCLMNQFLNHKSHGWY